MRIVPDIHTAAQDQAAVCRRVCIALKRHVSWGTDEDPGLLNVMLSHLSHPAVVAVAFALQCASRSGEVSLERNSDLKQKIRYAANACASFDTQPTSSGAALWKSVDLALPQHHLCESVTRALAAIPARHDSRGNGNGEVVSSEVIPWRSADRAVFRKTVDLLHAAWPQVLAELREIIYQVALLRGKAIDGFTDFGVHGAIMINQARLVTDDTGLAGAVRLAEALVHEGAHTRCNAAAVGRPFLFPANGSGDLVQTPLRADPRPLAGLFQQLVVLIRSALLYRRLPGGASDPAHHARQYKLIDQAHQGAETLTRHVQALTDHGRDVLAEARALLDGELAGAC